MTLADHQHQTAQQRQSALESLLRELQAFEHVEAGRWARFEARARHDFARDPRRLMRELVAKLHKDNAERRECV